MTTVIFIVLSLKFYLLFLYSLSYILYIIILGMFKAVEEQKRKITTRNKHHYFVFFFF